jgi:hypothetical protein
MFNPIQLGRVTHQQKPEHNASPLVNFVYKVLCAYITLLIHSVSFYHIYQQRLGFYGSIHTMEIFVGLFTPSIICFRNQSRI